jgi:hypothetical protein
MMAAAALVASKTPVDEILAQTNATVVGTWLNRLKGPFWPKHLGLNSATRETPVALIGPDRVRAILVNVYLPYLAATGAAPNRVANLLETIPREGDNQIARQTAHYLFGPDHSPSLYRTGLRRQGLTQIFHDYCLIDRSRCATCPFPNLLRNAYAK